MNAPRVLVIEDDESALKVTCQALELYRREHSIADSEVCFVESLFAARQLLVRGSALELVLLDLGLPDGWGHDLVREILSTAPRAQVVVTTVFDDDRNLLRALQLGATGYLLKGETPDEMATALLSMEQGTPPLSASIARRMLAHFAQSSPVEESPLTPRELEVVQLLARGLTNAEAANCLGISSHTVSTHVKSVYRKLQVSSRAELASVLERGGWVGSRVS